MASSDSHKRLSLKEFVWLGFNYAVGISFIVVTLQFYLILECLIQLVLMQYGYIY